MVLETVVAVLALVLALGMRPWRWLAGGRLLTPMLATVVLLPWLWALPALQGMPLQLQWSGACLVLLMLGWPLAIPVLCLAAVLAALISPMPWSEVPELATWLGVVPATLALGVGAAVRRLLGTHPFIYLLGRAFLGSAFCLFAAGVLRQWVGHAPAGVSPELTVIAHWLTAWGDAVVTGMLTAIFVAYRPQWLATWSDALYLRR